MNTVWWKGLKEEEKAELRKQLTSSKPVLDRLIKILQENIETIDSSLDGAASFETPAWAEKIAHLLGQRKALKKIKEIITIDQAKEE